MPTSKVYKTASEELINQVRAAGEKLKLVVDEHEISFTSLDKPMFFHSAESMNKPLTKPLTKRDYLIYLLQIADYVLPHLQNRPVTQIRFPNGMYGMRFFQKHSEQKLPEYVETVRYFSEGTGKDSDYFLCNNLPTLLWFAQLAVLEFHTMHSRIVTTPDALSGSTNFAGSAENVKSSLLNYPDFLVLDLDPYVYSGNEGKGEEPELHRSGFEKTAEVALKLKENLDSVGLTSFLKTSGKTGLHIFVPIIRNVSYEAVRALAQTLGVHLVGELPDDVTMEWKIAKRPGKIFFDHNMNGRGKTLASIYSPRATPEANVSTPITWDELASGKIYPTDFNIKNVPELLLKRGDLWKDILQHKNDLHKTLITSDATEANDSSQSSTKTVKPKSKPRSKSIKKTKD